MYTKYTLPYTVHCVLVYIVYIIYLQYTIPTQCIQGIHITVHYTSSMYTLYTLPYTIPAQRILCINYRTLCQLNVYFVYTTVHYTSSVYYTSYMYTKYTLPYTVHYSSSMYTLYTLSPYTIPAHDILCIHLTYTIPAQCILCIHYASLQSPATYQQVPSKWTSPLHHGCYNRQ